MSTIFSKIRDKEIPAEFLYEDEEIFAIKDIMPQANIHILIIPKKDIPTLNDITKSDTQLLGKMMFVASQLAQRFGIQDSGYRLVMNCNGDGGQTVFQLHLHLLGGEPLRGSFGN
ncbi:MAG TPA: histidine triad nucleotide-binding protein [Candidatus Kapabacteria bacterium]|jgi:histidine triad (HIT) family protein|nr:histidine triad nucleotide-binding protein [Candidatus Kapabacteria bacterium]